MSEFDLANGPEHGSEAGQGRAEQAKQMASQAGQALKQEAQSFASAAQERARAEAQKHTQTATKTLGDFANAVRKAGDELAGADQSPAARLVRQAADGLESLSRNLADKQPEDLLNAVRDFGRRNPAAFVGGAVLLGVALGRFVRASGGGGADASYGGQSQGQGGAWAYGSSGGQSQGFGAMGAGDAGVDAYAREAERTPDVEDYLGPAIGGPETAVEDPSGELRGLEGGETSPDTTPGQGPRS